jgi:hypothetical protein
LRDVQEWGPVMDAVNRDHLERLLMSNEKDRSARKSRRENRLMMLNGRRGGRYGSSDSLNSSETLLASESGDTWLTPEERQAWKCAHCNVCSGHILTFCVNMLSKQRRV